MASSYASALTKSAENTNYHQNAIDAAKAGDWDGVKTNLAQREQKVAETGENWGKTSADIYSELWNEYGAKPQQGSIAEMASTLKSLFSGGGAYAKALEQQQAANKANVEKAVGTLNAQKTSTDKSYADMFKQLYLEKMKAKKNIGQQMAAQGITGGAAESTMLGLNTQYADALRKGEESRIGAQSDLDKAIADARLTGDISNVQLAADSAKQQATSYANILQNLINRQDNLDAVEREEANNAKAYAYQTAMQLLQGGNMTSDELLSSAGISKADAASIVAAAKRTNAGAVTKPTAAQAELALMAAINGDRSESVRSIIESYYAMPLTSVLGVYGVTAAPGESDAAKLSRYLERANELAEGGATLATLANSIQGWVNSGEISQGQADTIAASFGF